MAYLTENLASFKKDFFSSEFCAFRDETVVVTLKVKMKVSQSYLTLEIPSTVTFQVPISKGFSRQEYWSRLPFPSPGEFSNPGIEPRSPALQVYSLPAELEGKP